MIQELINEAAKGGRVVNLEPGKLYELDEPLIIPYIKGAHVPAFTINGNGATIKIKGGYAIQRMVKDQSEAMTAVNGRVFIDHINFIGGGIQLMATFGSQVTRCTFLNCDTAIDMQFCMNAKIEQNYFLHTKSKGIVFQSGTWKGASANNSGCNQSYSTHNRHFCLEGQSSCLEIINSSGIVSDSDIFEGRNPINNIVYNAINSTTCKGLRVINPHLENRPTDCSVLLNPSGGVVELIGMWYQLNHTLVGIGESKGYTEVYIERTPWFVSGTNIFRHNKNKSGVSWTVEISKFQKLEDSAWCVGDNCVMPFYRTIKK